MNKFISSSNLKTNLLIFIVFAMIFFLGSWIQNLRYVNAQEVQEDLDPIATPCVPQSPFGQRGFTKNTTNTTVTYSFDGLDRTQRGAVDAAFAIWNNTSTCLNLKFQKIDSGGQAIIKIGNAGEDPALTTYFQNSTTHILVSATTELNLSK